MGDGTGQTDYCILVGLLRHLLEACRYGSACAVAGLAHGSSSVGCGELPAHLLNCSFRPAVS